MKSLSIYTFSKVKERLEIEARDPNGLWCIEMAKVPYKQSQDDAEEWDVEDDEDHFDNDFYLTADFDQNLTLLKRKSQNIDQYEEEELIGNR